MDYKNLNLNVVEDISKIKNEPNWMTEFRKEAFKKFKELDNPHFGPSINLDFDLITYYKRISDKIENDWNKVDKEAKETFETIGLK